MFRCQATTVDNLPQRGWGFGESVCFVLYMLLWDLGGWFGHQFEINQITSLFGLAHWIRAESDPWRTCSDDDNEIQETILRWSSSLSEVKRINQTPGC